MWLGSIEPFVKAVDGSGSVHFLTISLMTTTTVRYLLKSRLTVELEEQDTCLDPTGKLRRLLQSRIDQTHKTTTGIVEYDGKLEQK